MAIEPVKDTDPTIGRLVTDASRDISSLISKEIALAKSELKVSVKAGGIGAGLFAAAGFLGVLAIIMLSVAIAYFIHWNGSGLVPALGVPDRLRPVRRPRRPARAHRRSRRSSRCARRRRRSPRASRSRPP